MRNVFIIFLKELKRIFLDRRMLISLFLPGILIYVMYSIMGNIFNSSMLDSTTKDTTYQIVYTDNYNTDTTNKPKILSYLDLALEAEKHNNKVESKMIEKSEVEEYKVKIQSNEIDLIISFTDNFEQSVLTEGTINNINLFYNGESNKSNDIYNLAQSMVQASYTNYTTNIEQGKPVEANIGKKDAIAMKVMSMVIPMVTISILFSTIISLCPEAIAGEKERGTLALLLLTPIKRSEFTMGKILSLSVLAIASGTTSFLGLMLSFPKLMSGLNITILPGEIALLFFLVVSVLLLFVGVGVFFSSIAKSVKEASAYLGPMTVVFMMFGILPSLFGISEWYFAFIPILNVAASINLLLTGASNMALFFGITVASNTVYTALLIFGIAKLFKKERIILG